MGQLDPRSEVTKRQNGLGQTVAVNHGDILFKKCLPTLVLQIFITWSELSGWSLNQIPCVSG